jgi:Transport and Golgi organisation 2
MCTVTILPKPNGYILTHNRDEAPTRSPTEISRIEHQQAGTLLFPRDTLKSGTWIATDTNGRTACLLNGAFEKHKRQLPYRRSRGLMLLDYFNQNSDNDFLKNYDFVGSDSDGKGIEPFTFLVFRPHSVIEFRWDGVQKHIKELDATQPHFWCSATLYGGEMQLKRAAIFTDFLNKNKPISTILPKKLLNLHLTGSLGDPENDFVMNRSNIVRTVSITQVSVEVKETKMAYHDVLNESTTEEIILKERIIF